MAKYCSISDETRDLVLEVVTNTNLDNVMNFDVVGVSKSKQLIKVSRANAYAEYKTKEDSTIVVEIYEAAFDRLSDEQKRILVEDALNGVNYDYEKDKIVMGCPQIVVSLGGRAKYGETLLNASECGVLSIQQIEQEEADRKAAEKEAKKSAKKGGK